MITTNLSSTLKSSIDGLNVPQKEAVLYGPGPAVVFAGAGSGKTKVITTRIAVLLEQGFRPHEILAVTFTNKAAREMRQRVESLSDVGHLVHVGTFHSSCARWLREFAVELGFSSDFTIYDDKDSIQALKGVLKELKIKKEDHSPREYIKAINRAKTFGWSPKEAEKYTLEYPDVFPPLGAQVYDRYQSYLINCNAMDFSDLLMNTLLLLKRNKQVRTILQNRYKHILVDEYQDTNPTQYSLIKHLVNEDKNLFVVGDDDQSIYSWRGADPHNILNFETAYPGAKKIRLEQNYRSSSYIVQAASSIIIKNTKRAEKVLWTQNPPGEKIQYVLEYDAESESWWIADHIQEDMKFFPYKDTAILYRTNAQSRQLEDVLRRQKIPYRIYGSLRFYDRIEIKDMIAYCRLLSNQDDDVAFKRVLNTPTRGIGKKALEDIEKETFSNDLSMLQAAKKIIKEEPSRTTKKIESFIQLMNRLKHFLKDNPLSEFLPYLLKELDYKTYLQKKFPDQLQDKMSNLHELGAAIAEYSANNSKSSLANWLKDISLADSGDNSEEGGVHLMTLHAAKGLEFRKVYIAGVEDGLIPHSNSMEQEHDIEEERRLFYVGMTRAREKLLLLSARRRRILNNWQSYDPSRFLKDIAKDTISGLSGSLKDFISNLDEDDEDTNCRHLKIGSSVTHPTYGRGTIKSMDHDFGILKATIDFFDFGLRKVSLHHLETVKSLGGISYDYHR